jgi:hypothetical protein
MSGGTIAAIFVIIILILTPITVLARQVTRRRKLKERFGPEYEKVVGERQSRQSAEAELAARERRVSKFRLRALTDAAREKYEAQWIEAQELFVDDPSEAIADAQALVESVMRERGYPVTGYQQTVADLSVAHARTLDRFRSAHEVSERTVAGQTTTEELRLALLDYRELFGDLVGVVMTGEDHVGAA